MFFAFWTQIEVILVAGEFQRRIEPVRHWAACSYQIGDGKQLCSENARRRAFSDPGLRLDWRVQIS